MLAAIPVPAQDDRRPLQLRGSVRVEGEYNDNFFQSETNQLADYRERLTASLSLRVLQGRSHAEISYEPSFVHSSVNEGAVDLFHLFTGGGRLALSERLTLVVSDRFARTDEPAITDPQGLQRDRSIVTTNSLTSALTYQRDTWSLTPRYSLVLSQTESEATAAGGSNRPTQSTIHTVGIDGSRDLGPRDQLEGGYTLTIGAFDISEDFVGHGARVGLVRQLDPVMRASLQSSIDRREMAGGNTFNIYKADVGIRRDVSPRYTIEARGGYQATDTGSEGNGVTFLLAGTYTGNFIRLTSTSSQTLQETFQERENVGLIRTRQSTWELLFEPAERVAVTLRAGYRENVFLQSAAVDGRQREDRTMNAGMELALRITRLLTVTLDYAYTNVDSNVPGFRYESNRVRLGMTAVYE